MKIEQFTGFRTTDGEVFNTYAEARAHMEKQAIEQALIVFRNELQKRITYLNPPAWLGHDDRGNAVIFLESTGNLCDFLLGNREALLAALTAKPDNT